mmetsp:Transcript_60420/g.155741  ORF Transcript_60420/g.155741 Transcript_60420/m.155741 type:complete len:204 (-) Transcript_60420:528-1139(-)
MRGGGAGAAAAVCGPLQRRAADPPHQLLQRPRQRLLPRLQLLLHAGDFGAQGVLLVGNEQGQVLGPLAGQAEHLDGALRVTDDAPRLRHRSHEVGLGEEAATRQLLPAAGVDDVAGAGLPRREGLVVKPQAEDGHGPEHPVHQRLLHPLGERCAIRELPWDYVHHAAGTDDEVLGSNVFLRHDGHVVGPRLLVALRRSAVAVQ